MQTAVSTTTESGSLSGVLPKPSKRLDWADAAKGVAIILVVCGHVWRGIDNRGLVPPALFHAIDSRIYAFHMPVFFAVSGLFLAHSISHMKLRRFVIGRILRLVWPLVLWTYLFLAAKLLAGDFANAPVTARDLLRWPFPGYLHLWFLWALFLLHMAFLATRPLVRNGRYTLTALAMLAVLSVALALTPLPTPLARWIGDALNYAPFLVLGMVIGQTGAMFHITTIIRLAGLLLFTCLIAVWPLLPHDPAIHLAGSLVLTICFIIVVSAIGQTAPLRLKWLTALGRASMAIYLGHTIFAAAMREALLAYGINFVSVHLLCGVVAGISGSMGMLWIAQKTATERLFGF